MSHKGVTHSDSEDMQKIPHTIIRNGVYHFNRRYPQPVIDAGLVPKSHMRVSLKTSNPAEARRNAAFETIKFENEVEELTAELVGEDLHAVQNDSHRPLSALSIEQLKNLVIEWFVESERVADKKRRKVWETDDPEQIEAFRCATLEDARAEELEDSLEATDWNGVLRKFLYKKGISYDPQEEEEKGEELIGLLKRADRESYRRTLEFLERGKTGEHDTLFQGFHANTTLSSKPSYSGGRTVGELCDKYPTRKQADKLAPATLVRNEPQLRAFREFFGDDQPIDSLRHEDGEAFVRFLATIPTNVKKRKEFSGMTLPEAAKAAASLPEEKQKLLAPKSQRDTLNTILAALNYAETIQWIDRSPFSGRALSDLLPANKEKEIRSFTSDELKSLLNSEMFLKEKRKKGQARYWVTLIGLLHGIRQNEAASLLIEDLKEEDGIPYFEIRTTDDKGKVVKRLKTASSKRKVPLHKELIRMGFLEYVEERKERTELKPEGKGFLFDELTPNSKTGNRAKTLSQWFGRLRDKTIPEEEREGKTFHSFRHSVTDRLRELTESDEMRYQILGWEPGNEKKNAGYGYGTGFPMSSLKELVDQIEFPGFDFPSLYPENLGRGEDQ